MGSEPRANKELVLIVRDVKVSAPNGKQLVDGASFFLSKNAKVALVGSNGAGKSTLMKVIAGAAEVDSGEIRTAKKGQLVEYVPQFPPKQLLNKTLLDALTEHLVEQRGSYGEESTTAR